MFWNRWRCNFFGIPEPGTWNLEDVNSQEAAEVIGGDFNEQRANYIEVNQGFHVISSITCGEKKHFNEFRTWNLESRR